MNRTQLNKRSRSKALTLFAQKKIDREEYGALVTGRGWIEYNNKLVILPLWSRWQRYNFHPLRLIERRLT